MHFDTGVGQEQVVIQSLLPVFHRWQPSPPCSTRPGQRPAQQLFSPGFCSTGRWFYGFRGESTVMFKH